MTIEQYIYPMRFDWNLSCSGWKNGRRPVPFLNTGAGNRQAGAAIIRVVSSGFSDAEQQLGARLSAGFGPVSAGMLDLARRHRVHLLLAASMAGDARARPDGSALARELRTAAAFDAAREPLLIVAADGAPAAGVDVLLLKGTALAYSVYPASHLRPRVDIDVLIRRDALERAEARIHRSRLDASNGAGGRTVCRAAALCDTGRGGAAGAPRRALEDRESTDVRQRADVRRAARPCGADPGPRPRRLDAAARPMRCFWHACTVSRITTTR